MDKVDPVEEFEQSCDNAVQIQQELLQEILEKNSGCEYLQRYGGPKDLGAFKAWVPVISYEDVAADIQRIVDGDTSPILCSDPVTGFAISTGTSSGKPKVIPLTTDVLNQFKGFEASEGYKDMYFQFETSKPVGLVFAYCKEQFKTKTGLLLGSLTTSLYKSPLFKDSQERTITPYGVIVSGSDWWQTTYCHLLCGLLQRHKVDYIYAVFAFALSEALRMLRLEWEDICEDISSGCLNKKITDEKLRLPMSEVLKPSKEVAEEVRSICSRESWDGIIPLLWPRAKYVSAIVTGAMQAYVPALKRHAGELPIVGLDYGSSEGFLGISVQPDCPPEKVVFTILPFSVYFEFIPLDEEKESNTIVDITGVEPGKLYELVITTARGLYRYKVGDVVKVTGFYHKAPQIAFSHRKSAALSIASEKVDEYELQSVILDTSTLHKLEVANFSGHADFTSEQPPHYVIFWELVNREDYKRHDTLKECCDSIDKAFNMKYLTGRVNRAIGALELAVVKQGTFEKLMEHAICSGASPAQYKTPRCITAPGMLELLRNGTAGSYRSEEEVPVSLIKEWKPSFPGSQL